MAVAQHNEAMLAVTAPYLSGGPALEVGLVPEPAEVAAVVVDFKRRFAGDEEVGQAFK